MRFITLKIFLLLFLFIPQFSQAEVLEIDFDSPTTGSSLTEWTSLPIDGAITLENDVARSAPNSINPYTPFGSGTGWQYRIGGRGINIATTTQGKFDFFYYATTTTYSDQLTRGGHQEQHLFGFNYASTTGTLSKYIALGLNGGVTVLPINNILSGSSFGWTYNPISSGDFYPQLLNVGWNHITIFISEGTMDIIVNTTAIPTETLDYDEVTSFNEASFIYGTNVTSYYYKLDNRFDDLTIQTGSDYETDTGVVVSSEYDTRFTGVDFTYSSSTEQLTVDSTYFLDITEIDQSVPALNPAMVKIRWAETSSTTPPTNYTSIADNISVVDGNGTSTQTVTDLPDGVYIFEISFTNLPYQITQNEQNKPFPRTYMIFEIEISGGVITSQVVDTPYTGQEPEFQSTACSLTNFSGCLISAGLALFQPSNTSINSIKTSFDLLLTKKPFSYFSQLTTVIDSSANSTSSTAFINLELDMTGTIFNDTYPIITQSSLDAIYPTSTRTMVRDTIAYGLWILFALSLIFLSLNLFNKAGAYHGTQEFEHTSTTASFINPSGSLSTRTRSSHKRL